jgi:hypothetical protein
MYKKPNNFSAVMLISLIMKTPRTQETAVQDERLKNLDLT